MASRKVVKIHKVSQRIDADLDAGLKSAAAQLGKKRSVLVRDALETYLESLKVKTLAA
jgi:predicted DNA-binding protein